MFRYASAQRGRYREHWQFGVESLGSDDPAVDAEVIALQAAWYRRARAARRPRAASSTRSATRPAGPAYRALLVAYLERFRERALGRLAGAPRRQPAAHLRLQGRGRPARSSPARRASPTTSATTAREHFAGVRAFLDARGRRLPRRRRSWCAASTTTSAPPGSGSSRAAARRPGRSRAAAATTGWPSRSAASACPASASAAASSASCSRSRRRASSRAAPRRRLVLRLRRRRRAAARCTRCSSRRARAASRAEADLAGRSLKGQLRHARAAAARASSRSAAPATATRGIVRHGDAEIAFGDRRGLRRAERARSSERLPGHAVRRAARRATPAAS